MGSYGQPSKINAVTVVMLLGLLAGVYVGIQYGPPYWREYKVKEILDQAASKCRGNRVPQPEALDKLEEDAENKIQAAGIEDRGVRVRVDIGKKMVTVSATYKELVRHWVVKKVSTLHFTPTIERTRVGGL